MPIAIFTGGMRTPFCRAHKGALLDQRPDDMLVELLQASRSRLPELLATNTPDDLIVGCAYPEGEQGYNLGRMVAIGLDWPVPGATVNRLCASSLESLAMAAGRVASGWGKHFAVGGVESMSRVPRRGSNFSESESIKQTNPLAYAPNGDTAERVADAYPHLTREKQEALAARSHELAFKAYEDGHYQTHVHSSLSSRDEFIRYPVNHEKIASLKPAFRENGSVTAATSSPLSDGATAGWVLEKSFAQANGIETGLEIVDVAVGHVPPEMMGMGPVPATKIIFERSGITASDLAAVEINEAFAIQVLASLEDLQIDLEIVNCWGGAMSLGHPLGASGLRLMMTLERRMASMTAGSLGLATLCVGGGQGMSILVRKF
jgi:acetyl-CoA acyltransferase